MHFFGVRLFVARDMRLLLLLCGSMGLSLGEVGAVQTADLADDGIACCAGANLQKIEISGYLEGRIASFPANSNVGLSVWLPGRWRLDGCQSCVWFVSDDDVIHCASLGDAGLGYGAKMSGLSTSRGIPKASSRSRACAEGTRGHFDMACGRIPRTAAIDLRDRALAIKAIRPGSDRFCDYLIEEEVWSKF